MEERERVVDLVGRQLASAETRWRQMVLDKEAEMARLQDMLEASRLSQHDSQPILEDLARLQAEVAELREFNAERRGITFQPVPDLPVSVDK
ncbi:unnamed protein product [Protopolystoma xenopodis]|uniref:Uncharacterized protein n=1 Tax=Protopolystoma xenopodis TaxID=117903 RepID=A0A448XLI9_9PLAT|nr:unnamed protein product [Protopolystoma xenopodis]